MCINLFELLFSGLERTIVCVCLCVYVFLLKKGVFKSSFKLNSEICLERQVSRQDSCAVK